MGKQSREKAHRKVTTVKISDPVKFLNLRVAIQELENLNLRAAQSRSAVVARVSDAMTAAGLDPTKAYSLDKDKQTATLV